MNKTIVISVLLGLAAGRAAAVDVSTYSSAGCAFSDTNQGNSFTATSGEDHDYASSVSTMSFTVYNPVGISSVTVDNRTGLMWVSNILTDSGLKGRSTWLSAITSCTVTLNGMAYAGYKDWRLPNVRELLSILDLGRAVPQAAINLQAFPDGLTSDFWTSTTYPPTTTNAILVGFLSGGSLSASKVLTSNRVRCVRGGPP